MKNIKCPYCGSTSQIELKPVSISRNEEYFCEIYDCVCGTRFEVQYPIKESTDCIVYLLKGVIKND